MPNDRLPEPRTAPEALLCITRQMLAHGECQRDKTPELQNGSHPQTTTHHFVLPGEFDVLCRLNDETCLRGHLVSPVLNAPCLETERLPDHQRETISTSDIAIIYFRQNAPILALLPQNFVRRQVRLVFRRGTQRTGWALNAPDAPHPLLSRADSGQNTGFFFLPQGAERSSFGFWFVYGHALLALDLL